MHPRQTIGFFMVNEAIVRRSRLQSLSMMLRRTAARHPRQTALVCGNDGWSYSELDKIVDGLCRGLSAMNVAKGDRIAVLARNSHAFVALRFAIARLGAVIVPINFMLKAEEVRYVLEHSGARLLFVDRTTETVGRSACTALIEGVFGLPGEREDAPPGIPDWRTLIAEGEGVQDLSDASDLLQIIYTSGTESRPKGAVLTHDAVLWQYQSCVVDCEWTPDTVALHALPLFHCAQLDAMMGPALQVGARNIVTSDTSPENLISLLAKNRITSFFAPPTVWISLLRSSAFDSHDLSTLAKGYYGASIMPVEVLRELRRRLPQLRLWNLYGQTEIAPVATILFPNEQESRAGSAGRPTLHVTTRVVDEAMNDVAAGEIGEVVHQSPQLLAGYWKDPARTAEAFAGGWFHSGDLATVDSDGYLTIVDRKKDMIKSGGENISSREVEEVVYRFPGVAEVAVIGVPDPKWIERVTAVVVPRQHAEIDEHALIEHCRQQLADFKVPKQIVLASDLPRNASGKILKREIRQMVAS